MFNTQSDYALNKLDKEAIVCPSATGVHIRLTRLPQEGACGME